MLTGFFQLSTLSAWTAAVLAGIVVAAPYTVLGAMVASSNRVRPVGVITIAAGWTIAEYVSSQWLVPDRFGLLAQSQVHSPTIQIVDVVGQIAVQDHHVGVGLIDIGSNVEYPITVDARNLRRPSTRCDVSNVGQRYLAAVGCGNQHLVQ